MYRKLLNGSTNSFRIIYNLYARFFRVTGFGEVISFEQDVIYTLSKYLSQLILIILLLSLSPPLWRNYQFICLNYLELWCTTRHCFSVFYDVFVRIVDDEINFCICISAIHKYVQLISKLCIHTRKIIWHYLISMISSDFCRWTFTCDQGLLSW
jgi:hypothetical protein